MAVINFGERWAVRQIDTTLKQSEWTSQVSYIATTDVENESHWVVWDYANVNGPHEDNILVRINLSVQQITADRYYCVFDFGSTESEASDPEKTPSDPAEFSFTTSGGTISVTHSLDTVEALQGGDQGGPILDDSPYNFKRALNVDPETGKPSPVDIISRSLGYTEKKVFANPLDCAFLKVLRDATATVNDAPWRCFEAGEVLFTGVTGSQRGIGDWDLTFNFKVERNVVNGEWPDPIDGFPAQVITYDKKGHEYLWVYLYGFLYSQALIDKTTVKRPAVYVEEMYPSTDFTLLGLG